MFVTARYLPPSNDMHDRIGDLHVRDNINGRESIDGSRIVNRLSEVETMSACFLAACFQG